MKRLGRLIQERRIHRGLRGDELAYAIGKAPSWVSRMENGEHKTLPDPETLAAIADRLGLTQGVLLEAAGYDIDRQTVSANPFPPDDIRYRVVEAMKALDISGPEFAFWTGHFSMQLRMYRDIATYGLGHVDDEAETETPNYMVDRRARTGS